MILIYTILTPIRLFQILTNLHFLFISLLPQLTLILSKKNIHPNNIQIPIAHVFTTFLNNLQEKNNLLPKHVFNPSSIQELLQKESLFDIPNIEQFRTVENNPHHWLTTDILQIHLFQYQFFQNITLNKNTKEQIQIYSLFLRKFFRHNYQLVWHSKFQNACTNFPQQFTNDELLPFLDTVDNQHPHFYNLLDFPSSHFVYLTYDSNSINKSLNLPSPVRPYFHQYNTPPSNVTISTVSIQTLPSSSNPVTNPTSSLTQHISPSTFQDTSLNHRNPPPTSQTTTINNNPLFLIHQINILPLLTLHLLLLVILFNIQLSKFLH